MEKWVSVYECQKLQATPFFICQFLKQREKDLVEEGMENGVWTRIYNGGREREKWG